MRIEDLPDDVLLNIALLLSVLDVLALKQTCRVLHAFGSTEYLWHRLIRQFDLPIDIPPGVPIHTLSPDELQRQAIKALRLEDNWKRRVPVIKQSRMILGPNREPFAHMELLQGGRWLLTAQRYHRLLMTRITTRMSVWWLADVSQPACIFSVEISGTYRSSTMALNRNSSFATVIVAFNEDNQELLEVHAFPLKDSMRTSYSKTVLISPGILRRLVLPPYPLLGHRVIQDTVLVDGIIATTVAIFGDHGGVSFHILLANADIGQLQWVDPHFSQDLNCVKVRLYDGYIFIVGQKGNTTIIRVHKLPQLVQPSRLSPRSSKNILESPLIDLGPVVTEYAYSLPKGMISLTDELHVPPRFHKLIPIVMFDIAGAAIQGTRLHSSGCVITFPYDLEGLSDKKTCTVLPCPVATSQQLGQIGATGRRMIWLEHDLETGRNQVMKFAMATESRDYIHGILLPAQANLPFALDACNALAFDEVSGRLCLAFYDGSLHVLDFV